VNEYVRACCGSRERLLVEDVTSHRTPTTFPHQRVSAVVARQSDDVVAAVREFRYESAAEGASRPGNEHVHRSV
jgi:hypothetical protein